MPTPSDPSDAWSPKILGHQNHQFQSIDADEHQFQHHQHDQTIPFTPTDMNDTELYLDYLNEIRENGNHFSVLDLSD